MSLAQTVSGHLANARAAFIPANAPQYTAAVGYVNAAQDAINNYFGEEEPSWAAEVLAILAWILEHLADALESLIEAVDNALRAIDPQYDPPGGP